MKALLLLPLFFFTAQQAAHVSTVEQTSQVYICVSKSAYAYHYNRNCRGLARCSHDIKKLSLNDAKTKYKRKLCGYEK